MATIKKASRQKVKIKLGYAGPAGAGKTMSSLLTAFGLCGNWDKVLLIDTENGSGELYSDLGNYNVISLAPPFTPESYVDAIKLAEQSGAEVIIIDSVSHEWEGKGGILETHSNMTGNSFTNWGKLTPRHNKFVESILQSNCHVICTLRTKTDYVLVEKNGKQVPEKVGLKAITREGWEYDLTVVFDLDIKQQATSSKDRTNMFMNKPQFTPSPSTGQLIRNWCETGVEQPPTITLPEALSRVAAATTIDSLRVLKAKLTKEVLADDTFIKAATEKFKTLQPAPGMKNEDLVNILNSQQD